MSLFDILKYSSIDLDSVEDLTNLPHELLDAYRDAAFAYYDNTAGCDGLTHIDKILGLAYWREDNHTDTYCVKQFIFNKILKKYYSEPV